MNRSHPLLRDAFILLVGALILGTAGTCLADDSLPVAVGQVGPIASDNPRQEPFACEVQDAGLGQPVVDNHDGIGYPVTSGGAVVGYSADCGAPTRVDYYYRAKGDADTAPLHPWSPSVPPSGVTAVKVHGRRRPFIVRFERGTINRFIYSIAVLAPHPHLHTPNHPDLSGWNHELVFYFIGGTGIGHTQSHAGNALRAVHTPGEQTGALALLARGYAVVNSTGAATATTYNLVLTGETARMVKEQFVGRYARPRHTFGLGGSGGAVQQLVYAQSDPGLLDALIPVQPFPDMITQVNPVGDCELLQYYFDVTDARVNGTGQVDPKWTTWANRQEVVGLHGIDGYATNNAIGTSAGPGSDVCIEQWRGAIPQFFNPLFGSEGSFRYIDPAVLAATPLSFFDDLVGIFGPIPGTSPPLGRSVYDNVGVQYGLWALRDGDITTTEFLDLNAHVGGWKPRQDFVAPGFPYEGDPVPGNIDPWSARNATAEDHMDPSDVAPRSHGSLQAMQRAYEAGLVFRGDLHLPIIIVEPYLEPELNEHATREPFAVRQRLIRARGDANNLAIWMIGNDSDALETRFVLKALRQEHRWLTTGRRPRRVQDACYDGTGALIAKGASVWNGEVSPGGGRVLADTADGGACTRVYPIYSDARVVSGENVIDDIFACQLEPVDTALADGAYGNVTFTDAQKARLRQIFPTGVCNYDRPDQGLPPAWQQAFHRRPGPWRGRSWRGGYHHREGRRESGPPGYAYAGE